MISGNVYYDFWVF